MLRIRSQDKSVTEVPAGCMVEICDTTGKIAVAFVVGQDRISAITGKSPEAERYSKLFGTDFSGLIKLPPELTEQPRQST